MEYRRIDDKLIEIEYAKNMNEEILDCTNEKAFTVSIADNKTVIV